MKAKITITWDEERDETIVKYSAKWRSLSNLSAADCLKDSIAQLQSEYNVVLKEGV